MQVKTCVCFFLLVVRELACACSLNIKKKRKKNKEKRKKTKKSSRAAPIKNLLSLPIILALPGLLCLIGIESEET